MANVKLLQGILGIISPESSLMENHVYFSAALSSEKSVVFFVWLLWEKCIFFLFAFPIVYKRPSSNILAYLLLKRWGAWLALPFFSPPEVTDQSFLTCHASFSRHFSTWPLWNRRCHMRTSVTLLCSALGADILFSWQEPEIFADIFQLVPIKGILGPVCNISMHFHNSSFPFKGQQ